MSTSSMIHPSGITTPFTSDNGNDHSGLIVVIATFHLVLVLASVIARIYSIYQQKTIQHNNYLFGGVVVRHHLSRYYFSRNYWL